MQLHAAVFFVCMAEQSACVHVKVHACHAWTGHCPPWMWFCGFAGHALTSQWSSSLTGLAERNDHCLSNVQGCVTNPQKHYLAMMLAPAASRDHLLQQTAIWPASSFQHPVQDLACIPCCNTCRQPRPLPSVSASAVVELSCRFWPDTRDNLW